VQLSGTVVGEKKTSVGYPNIKDTWVGANKVRKDIKTTGNNMGGLLKRTTKGWDWEMLEQQGEKLAPVDEERFRTNFIWYEKTGGKITGTEGKNKLVLAKPKKGQDGATNGEEWGKIKRNWGLRH